LLVKDFRKTLNRGLGAPLFYLIDTSNNPKRKYINPIIQACIKRTAYDPQAEGDRTEYLYEVCKQSGYENEIQRHILEHLVKSQNEYDIEQMLRLAKRFVDAGCVFRPHPDTDSGNIRTA
jgi:hypothetical protein